MNGSSNPPNPQSNRVRNAVVDDDDKLRLTLVGIVTLDYKCGQFLAQALPKRKSREMRKLVTTACATLCAFFGGGLAATLSFPTPPTRAYAVVFLLLWSSGFLATLFVTVSYIVRLLAAHDFGFKNVDKIATVHVAICRVQVDFVLKRDPESLVNLQTRLRQIKEELGNMLEDVLDPDEPFVWERVRDLLGAGAYAPVLTGGQ